MGKLNPIFKSAFYDNIINSMTANTSRYYAFASNPIEITGNTPAVSADDYSTNFSPDWKMIFGKKLTTNDIIPVIEKNIWTSNTVYDRYDNTSTSLYNNNNYYVVSEPSTPGGSYIIYVCIDNNNGESSTVDPSSFGTPTQATTFQTSDNYKWRYVSTISNSNYLKFSTTDYIPVYTNSTLSSTSESRAGVEVVVVSNSGTGYDNYHEGTVLSVTNSTLVQISSNASSTSFYYNNNAIYFNTGSEATSQLLKVSNYIHNSGGNWVYLDSESNTNNITPSITQYKIVPNLIFTSDGNTAPVGYCTVNNISNSISSVVILDNGSYVTWANVQVSSIYGSGANLYCIVPPPGGFGHTPASELNMKGIAFAFSFANNESNTILTSNVVYNQIGLIENPYSLGANNTKGAYFNSNTFSQTTKANVSPSYTFSYGETIVGANSGSRATVIFSNSSVVYFVGDKNFIDGEYIANTSNVNVTTISITNSASLYAKDVKPLYIQNINNVNRSNTQTESFKIIIQV
ncbi:hypothetical protein UFOVP787_119 [uncultured Caudovirales phage]|uniref:Uncharacterized protein n=1 Tax=uncultured Caudovirales phage TaxID=2100421 RepID=A0A6J5NYK0_9CAUD|nr:hypothetical protein UFOVP787_119 [uncultured Caudovirales phage]